MTVVVEIVNNQIVVEVGAGESVSLIAAAGSTALAAVTAAGAAQIANIANVVPVGEYPTSAKALSGGVASVTITAAGSGGTNGVYYWTTTGGGGTNASGFLTVVGGAISVVTVEERGYDYTSAPTIVIAGTHNVTGHTLTAIISQNQAAGSYWRSPATGGFEVFENVGGVATSRGIYPNKAVVDDLVIPVPNLVGFDNGFHADFTNPIDTERCAVRTDEVNAFSGVDSKFLNTGATAHPNRVRDSAGAWIWTAHNLYINSATPATQTIDVVTGEQYTVRVTGDISLVLSNGGAGTCTSAATLTFTATTDTLVSTKSGTSGTIQINRGATALDYLATGADPRYGVPVSYNKDLTGPFVLQEPTRTNYLPTSTVPITRTVSLTANTYTLWVEGSGSYALSGGPTGTATEDNPVTFTLGSTTSVTFTKTGTLTHVQCEQGLVPTSQIRTFAAAATRSRSLIEFALSQMPSLGTSWAVSADFAYAGGDNDFHYFFAVATDGGNYVGARMETGGVIRARTKTTAVEQHIGVVGATITVNTRNTLTFAVRPTSFRASLNGAPFGSGGIITASYTAPAVTTCYLGRTPAENTQQDILKIYSLTVIPEDLPSDLVSSRFYTYPVSNRRYVLMLSAGQSNSYFGLGITGADVSDGHQWQINQLGVLSAANEPLAHPVPAAGYMGPHLAFARDGFRTVQANPRDDVLLLPCGVSDTGFSDNRWNPGDDLYERALNMIGVAVGAYPNSYLSEADVIYSLFSIGEKQAQAGWTQSQQAVAMDAMIAAFRVRFPTMRFIFGSMNPQYVAAQGGAWVTVQAALAATPTRVWGTAYANAGASLGQAGDVHYTGPENSTFGGVKYLAAFETL